MLCEKCKKRTATVFYHENINGKTRAYSLCGECAAKLREAGELQEISTMMGSFADPHFSIPDDLFGGFFGMPVKSISSKKKCAGCGCTYSEIAEHGRVGCPSCYVTFKDELAGTIRSIHGTTSHTGSVPAKHRARLERQRQIDRLRDELGSAIAKENYERAASLRDEIRSLESEQGKEAK